MNFIYAENTTKLFNKYLDIYNISCEDYLCEGQNQAKKAVCDIQYMSNYNEYKIFTSFYCVNCFDAYGFASVSSNYCIDLKNINEDKMIKYFKNAILLQ